MINRLTVVSNFDRLAPVNQFRFTGVLVMKDLKYVELLEVYGRMLTDKQATAMEQYYNLDLSLAEIAEDDGVSRQAVRSTLIKAQNILDNLEANIGFLKYLKSGN